MVPSALLKTLESNRSWPFSLLLGVSEDLRLEEELCEDGGESLSSSRASVALRFFDGVLRGESTRCVEGVDGREGGGLGRLCSGIKL